jgi:hypothetical protein
VLVEDGAKVRLGAVCATLGCLVRVATPRLNRGYLRELLDLELRAVDSGAMASNPGSDTLPAASTRPISLTQSAHAYVPQKSSTHTKPPFMRYARSASTSRGLNVAVPYVLHVQVRTLEQRIVGQANGDEFRPAVGTELDPRSRELG